MADEEYQEAAGGEEIEENYGEQYTEQEHEETENGADEHTEDQQQQDDGEAADGQEEEVEEGENGAETGDAPHDDEQQPTSTGNTDTTLSSDAPLGTKIGVRGSDDDKKIFVGGLHWETTAQDLKEYFGKFGAVVDCTLKMDHNTGKSRGFGFVLFEETSTVEQVIADKSHTLKGKTVDVKRALSKPGKEPVKKIFVGGISPDMPEAEIREYFSQYGKIEEIELPFDKSKNQRRAFCFVTFETEEMADKAVIQAKQKIGEKEVDLRKATPKTDHDGFGGGRGGRGAMRGGQQRGGGFQQGGYGGGPQGYAPPQQGYDYSSYYGYGYGYGYPGYGAPGYDYSGYGYYGQQQGGDWSGYAGYGYQDPSQQQQPAAGGGGFKAKRGSGSNAYHPYSR